MSSSSRFGLLITHCCLLLSGVVLFLLAPVSHFEPPRPPATAARATAPEPPAAAPVAAVAGKPVAVAAVIMSQSDISAAPLAVPLATTTVLETKLSAGSTPAVRADGVAVHTVQRGESLPAIVRTYLPRTSFMRGSELEAAIRAANGGLKGIALKPGAALQIPGYEAAVVEHPGGIAKDAELRAIYLTGTMAGSAHGLDLIQRWKALGGNAVVFDIKDSDGLVNVPFDHPLASHRTPPLRNLPKFVRYVHARGMVAIARIAIFRDEYLVAHHPELAVRSRGSGQAWRENGKLVWTDPSHPEVQQYNIALARFAAECGVDEVQFDYVRFPAEGDQKDAQFAFEKSHPQWQRADVIADFLAQAHAALQPRKVLFSLDVFGVMAWQRPVDLSHTGQDIVRMARHCDVLSPMIYPSHFFGMDGYSDPGDAPEHFIGESMDKFRAITRGSGVVLRPWLQAFGWRTRTYSPDYILKQVSVARDKGGIGFLFWNARNDYSKPFAAMPEITAHPARYLQPGPAEKPKPATAEVAREKQSS